MTNNVGLTDLIDNQVTQESDHTEIGRVVKVYDKQNNSPKEGNIEADVMTRDQTHTYRRIPCIGFSHPGQTYCPQVDDHVLVTDLSGRGSHHVVIGTTYTSNEHRAPHAKAGHWRHEFDSDDGKIYLEAEPSDGSKGDPNKVSIAHKPDGITKATSEITLDISDGNTIATIDVGDDKQRLVLNDNTNEFELIDDDKLGVRSDGKKVITLGSENNEQVELDNNDGSFSLTDANDNVVESDGGDNVVVDINNGEQGIHFNTATGAFSLLDAGGYGITSDGSGNFKWYHQTVDYKPGVSTSLPYSGNQ